MSGGLNLVTHPRQVAWAAKNRIHSLICDNTKILRALSAFLIVHALRSHASRVGMCAAIACIGCEHALLYTRKGLVDCTTSCLLREKFLKVTSMISGTCPPRVTFASGAAPTFLFMGLSSCRSKSKHLLVERSIKM